MRKSLIYKVHADSSRFDTVFTLIRKQSCSVEILRGKMIWEGHGSAQSLATIRIPATYQVRKTREFLIVAKIVLLQVVLISFSKLLHNYCTHWTSLTKAAHKQKGKEVDWNNKQEHYSKVSNKRTVQCTLINFLEKSSLYALIKDLQAVPTPLNIFLDG